MIENQLSRYGAISKNMPFNIGKTFFLLNATEALNQTFGLQYPVDKDGIVRVYTTWAAVIAATTAGNFDAIYVSPNFTTAPTLAQIATLDTNGASVYQMGQTSPDGSYFCTKAASGLPASTTKNLFQVNGRIQLLNILGEVTTVIQAQANATKLTMAGTVGAAVDLCATGDINAAAVGTQLSITGTLATGLVITPASALVAQAAPLVLTAGILKLNCAATNTGAVKWRLHYKPLDPGAFVSAL